MFSQYLWIDTPEAYAGTISKFCPLKGKKVISLHPAISYITTVISTCSFVSHDYVPPSNITDWHLQWGNGF